MWKIFYSDGETFSSEDGRLTDAPARDVQVIIQDDKRVGVELVTGGDYYVFWKGKWRAVDIFGLFDYLIETGLVKFGRTVTQEEYNQAIKKANEEKTAWLPRERR